MKFSDEQIERYSRNIILKEIGGRGQQKLLDSRVLVVGAGGLGSPVDLYLAAAGVGTIGIVDGDRVELSNLQRQVVHFTADLGREKSASAGEKIHSLNPEVTVHTYPYRLLANNIRPLLRDYDFIIECTDNFAAKFMINDACVLENKPFSTAGVVSWYGQTMTHIPGSACMRCLNPEQPAGGPTCASAGILGAVAGLLGTIQVAETVKYLLGAGELLADRILFIDALNMAFNDIKLSRDEHCPVCGPDPSITEVRDGQPRACDLDHDPALNE